jgi:methylmalonyl-CoA mutase
MTTYEEWKAKATSDLKGADFDRRLRTRLLDGTIIEPIYHDAPPVSPLPREHAGFKVGTIVPLTANAAEFLQDDVQGGTETVLFCSAGSGGSSVDDILALARSLPDAVSAGFFGDAATALLLAESDACSIDRPAVDLLTLAPEDRQHAFERALAAADRTGLRTLVIDGGAIYEAGGTELHALGFALSSVWQVLDWAPSPEGALAALTFRLRAGRDYVRTVAMIRALRLLVAHVQNNLKLTPTPIDIEVISSRREFTMLDRWSNMIRGTVGACASIVGGADRVFVLPLDEPVSASPTPQARRSARNALLVAAHESHMGWVNDPAAGAWAFESLTSELCEQAWALGGTLDDAGGALSTAGQQLLHTLVSGISEARAKGIANRSFPIVGSSEYPNGQDVLTATGPMLRAAGTTDDAVWHALRLRGEALGDAARVSVLLLDEPATMRARLGWVQDLLACAGLASDVATLAEAPSGAAVTVLCGPDSSWPELPATLAEHASAIGRSMLVLAGKPTDAAPLTDAGVRTFVHAGADLLGALQHIVSRIEEVSA